jgi:histidinol dehydrogenase
MIKIVESSNTKAVTALLSSARVRDRATEARAARIVGAVRREGDRALRRYARELDGLAGPIEIPRAEWERRAAELPRGVRTAIRRAALHIRRVARAQVPRGFRLTVTPGVVVEQRVVPLQRVGCYVPGGRYPLPSSLLMTAIPARVAGVETVVAVCARPHPAVMAAAVEAGIDRFFQIGGAHAVSALAYGTRSVPRVDKIVGPGNKWVAAAKTLVSRDCSIDFHAGPTEILIVANTGPARWLAADLIAQAEHDPDARAGPSCGAITPMPCQSPAKPHRSTLLWKTKRWQRKSRPRGLCLSDVGRPKWLAIMRLDPITCSRPRARHGSAAA